MKRHDRRSVQQSSGNCVLAGAHSGSPHEILIWMAATPSTGKAFPVQRRGESEAGFVAVALVAPTRNLLCRWWKLSRLGRGGVSFTLRRGIGIGSVFVTANFEGPRSSNECFRRHCPCLRTLGVRSAEVCVEATVYRHVPAASQSRRTPSHKPHRQSNFGGIFLALVKMSGWAR
jgi:hypothetical protein